MAEPPLALVVAFQYWPEPSLNAVPPMPVTSGMLAGESTESPAPAVDLPVTQSATQELVINLRAARTLGLGVPANLLAEANEVIE